MFSSRLVARVGAAAAVLGGVLWVVKGAGILVTGEQPPVVFALGPPLFALGLVGLYARLARAGGRAAIAGFVLACISIFLAGVQLVAWVFASEALPAGEEDVTRLPFVIAGAGFSLIAGLVLLGVAARRAHALPPRWRALPLVVGVLAVPGIMIGGVLSGLSERLLEIPLVAFALGWIVIGYLTWPSQGQERGTNQVTWVGREGVRDDRLEVELAGRYYNRSVAMQALLAEAAGGYVLHDPVIKGAAPASEQQRRHHRPVRIPSSVRWGSAAAVVAGAVWLLVWAHQAYAHGVTQVNEKKIVLGLTWMDSAKFLVIPFALLVVTIGALRALRGRPRWPGRAGFAMTNGALVLLTVGVAFEFWAFPWGSYAHDFDEPLPKYGGVVQTLASLALTIGALLLAFDLSRSRVLPIWIGLVLVAGAVTTIYLTPVLPVPGLAWLVLGAVLWQKSRSSLEVSPESSTPDS